MNSDVHIFHQLLRELTAPSHRCRASLASSPPQTRIARLKDILPIKLIFEVTTRGGVNFSLFLNENCCRLRTQANTNLGNFCACHWRLFVEGIWEPCLRPLLDFPATGMQTVTWRTCVKFAFIRIGRAAATRTQSPL